MGNLYLSDINEIWYAEDDNRYVCHTRAKGFLDSNLNEVIMEKYKIFKKLPQISHMHNMFKAFHTYCFFAINFTAGTCRKYIFAFLRVVRC